MDGDALTDDRDLRYRRLIELGLALSAERSHDRLLEKILLGAKELANADGGTLYLVSEDGGELRFMIMRNDSLAIALGGTTGAPVPPNEHPPVPLLDAEGRPNHRHVAAFAAHTGQTVAIADVYDADGFDFSGPRAFDARTGYRSGSFLTVPLKNHEEQVIGVLQLINACAADGRIQPFPADAVPVIEALASQAAVALDNHMLLQAQEALTAVDRRLVEIGIALSAERDQDRLLEKILLYAKQQANADGGTLYLLTEDGDGLRYAIMHNDSMRIAQGGTTGNPIAYPPVPLRTPDGRPNHGNVVAFAAYTGQTVNIDDVYDESEFDFSGPRQFDAETGYRSRSLLTVPLMNHDAEAVGVLQLINARSPEGRVHPFAPRAERVIKALASQAAIALDNHMLLAAQKRLFFDLLDMLAGAIDAKSPYTGGHCRRVPEITEMLARAADAASDGPLADFHLEGEEWEELKVAGGLHDCGKVTTREFVVDKATKLETLYNRIHEIRTRFEVVKRDAEIEYLKAVAAGGDEPALRAARDTSWAQLDDDFAFVAECNIGGEFMGEERIERLRRIAETTWLRTIDDGLGLSWEERSRQPEIPAALPAVEHLLADKPSHLVAHDAPPPDKEWRFNIKPPPQRCNLGEVYNLSIHRGTLTAEERYHINDHIVQTIIMLNKLRFPKNLRRVPEWAGGHHEKMDGTGYPLGLKGEEMSVPARIMAIADIFEALSARDRPYKGRKRLSECLAIMQRMSQEGHIDPDLYALFLTSGVYRDYAEKRMLDDQIDACDPMQYMPAGR